MHPNEIDNPQIQSIFRIFPSGAASLPLTLICVLCYLHCNAYNREDLKYYIHHLKY